MIPVSPFRRASATIGFIIGGITPEWKKEYRFQYNALDDTIAAVEWRFTNNSLLRLSKKLALKRESVTSNAFHVVQIGEVSAGIVPRAAKLIAGTSDRQRKHIAAEILRHKPQSGSFIVMRPISGSEFPDLVCWLTIY